jgi:hypothetical protein
VFTFLHPHPYLTSAWEIFPQLRQVGALATLLYICDVPSLGSLAHLFTQIHWLTAILGLVQAERVGIKLLNLLQGAHDMRVSLSIDPQGCLKARDKHPRGRHNISVELKK